MNPAVEKERRRLQKLYDGVKEEAESIIKILLSFNALLTGLSQGGKTPNITRGQMLSILKGPFFSSTRRKLIGLDRHFTVLEGNLEEFYSFFRRFDEDSRKYKGDYPEFYHNTLVWWKCWVRNRNINIFRKRLLAKLSITPWGDFYRDLAKGYPRKVGEEAAALKKDVQALLAIVEKFK